MNKQNEVPDFYGVALKIKENASRMVATEAKKHFKDSFVKKGWTGESFEHWAEGKSPLGRKLMYNKGDLMNSIETLHESESKVETGTRVRHAKIHNEGGAITVTPQMKKFWWAKYYELSGQVSKTKRGTLASKSRRVNDKAMFCKQMALMKVGSKIRIPKRQFIGESRSLMQQFDKWLGSEIDKQIKDDL